MKPPKASSDAVRRSMQGNKSKGTLPERTLARMVWGAGFRGYRKNDRRIPGKPDLYLPSLRLAVMMNGCFWHRCPHCKPTMPKSNADFWSDKFERNRERDARQKRLREELGIRSLVVWECQLKKNPERVLGRMIKMVKKHFKQNK